MDTCKDKQMKKTSREYAEKLAKEYAKPASDPKEKFFIEGDFASGYLKCVEENNVEELIEALVRAKDFLDRSESDEAQSLSFDIKFLIE